MSEYERAKALLDKQFKEVNDRLENPAAGRGNGTVIEGKFTLSAYIKSVTEINQALEQVEALQKGRTTNGIRRRKAKRPSDAAASAAGHAGRDQEAQGKERPEPHQGDGEAESAGR